jgi:hypothetical protein
VWLGVLRLLVMWLPQRAAIVDGGDLQRAPGRDRIAFLAAVRDAALVPLWQARAPAFSVLHTLCPAAITGASATVQTQSHSAARAQTCRHSLLEGRMALPLCSDG